MPVISKTLALSIALLWSCVSVSSSSFRASLGDDDVVDTVPLLDRIFYMRRLAAEASWFNRMQVEDTTGILKRCYKRSKAPVDGSSCSRYAKMCYFGMQSCTTVGDHPTIQCTCIGAIWSCQPLTCPSAAPVELPVEPPTALPVEPPTPPPVEPPTELPVESPTCDDKIAAQRDTAVCPPVSPFDDQDPDNSCSVEGTSCSYGSEECCGECFPLTTCDCFDGQWTCYLANECLFPSCEGGANEDPSASPSLAPTSTAPTPLRCPEDRFALCTTGSSCEEIVSVVPKGDQICTTTDVCSCQNSGFYQCVPSEDCVSQIDPRSTSCPTEKAEACEDEGQICTFTSEHEFPMAEFAMEKCTSTESCACVDGAYACGPMENSCVQIDRDLKAFNGDIYLKAERRENHDVK